MVAVASPVERFGGLTDAEVVASRAAHGANRLAPPPREPWWRAWLAKFDDPVIRILGIAAGLQIAVGAAHGEYLEGVAIVAAIFLATTLAFVNERRAHRAFDLLSRSEDDAPHTALRNGAFTTVARGDLVVGDVFLADPGDEVPCDADLLDGTLDVDESRLTGESLPVSKHPTSGECDGTYAANRLVRGSLIAAGHGVARAVAVGDRTELGQTARLASEETDCETPLQRQLARLGQMIGAVGLAVAALTFGVLAGGSYAAGELGLSPGQAAFALAVGAGTLVALARVWLPIVRDGVAIVGRGFSVPGWVEREGVAGWAAGLALGVAITATAAGVLWLAGLLPHDPTLWLPAKAARSLLDDFMVAIVIIVVAVPEGLAMSVTMALAYSMRAMTAQHTLVRRMHACETIGAATVVCSDKTGTLTLNQMRVAEARLAALDARTLDALAVNGTAQLGYGGLEPEPLGNPTEAALLLWLHGRGHDYQTRRAAFQVAHRWPFTTERKCMATAGRPLGGEPCLHVKGAPELILAGCPMPAADRERIAAEIADAQRRGLRTLGFAVKPGPADTGDEPPLADLEWLGHVAVADPVRPEVPAAVRACASAGIRVIVVTGDTAATAGEIARQAGLLTHGEGVLLGPAFAAMSDFDAAAALPSLRVLARARPADKLRLVRLLQAAGEVVAVTGDGTNDAPALNHSDVGLAMGKSGTAAAREAASIVLLDDSFASIVTAVKWGRGLYENIQRFLVYQLTINVAALGLALLGPLAGVDFPLTVLQMLWVNLIMDTFAALALATEPPRPEVLRRPPRSPAAFIVTPAMARAIARTGGLVLAAMLGLLVGLPRLAPHLSEPERLTVVFTAFVLLQFWNLFNARAFGSARPAFAGLRGNPAFVAIAAAILGGQVLLVQVGGPAVRVVPLSAAMWGVLLVATSPILLAGEAVRAWRRRLPVSAG